MNTYSYRAMKDDGKKLEGMYEANSRDEVVEMITANGFYPLKVEEVTKGKKTEIRLNNRVTTKDLAIFCRQLYTMLDAGVSITNSLNMLAMQLPSPRLRTILSEIEESVKKGEMLSVAMKRYKEFPQLLISMVESGESTGNIDTMMLRMASHFEKETKTNNKVKSAMIYPICLAVVAVAAVMFILTFVMPTFAELFEENGADLPFITSAMIGASDFLKSYWFIIVAIIAIIVVAIKAYAETEDGKVRFSALALKFPIVANLNKKVIVARFTRTLATLLSAGISLVQALPIVSAVLGNKIAQQDLDRIRERVVRGDGLSAPIAESDIFPDMLASMVRIGEESGALDDILNKTADFYEEEVDQAITQTTELMQPIVIVIMGIVVGIMVMGIMLPMFDMYTIM
ncbi:type II secretion system F family protein [Clostridium sp. HCP1S3_B4]|uniref:type II secretion system F family protein n=1 Tax=unclassified Clostridium TaxID=2614128 RepID=UPI003F88B6ED|nr:type II secretion system F family protein [Clostridiales bacterium]